jgi:predicted amidohydrolase
MDVDAADLFCEIFDQFERPDFNHHEMVEWLTDAQVMDISSLTEGQVLETGTLDADEVWSSIEIADDADKRRFAYLQGIDNALMHAHPHTASHDSAGLTAIASRYARTGKFSTDATAGALLPRYAFPAEDDLLTVERLADTMTSVVRVSETEWSRTDHVVLPAISDFHRLHRERGVIVGCVPFLEDLDELEWEVNGEGEVSLFRSHILAEDKIRRRISSVLNLLDESGTMVGVVPELCLSDQVLAWWREAIAGNPGPRDGKLRWIFVGTGPIGDGDPPPNAGFLLDRLTGETLMRQDKLFPFHLKSAQIETWGLEDRLGADGALEDITRGRSVTVAESVLGRLCVLICEDLARTIELGPSLRDHGFSLAICPVFSKPIQPFHWEHNKAKDYADRVGTQVIVANSRAVGCNQGEVSFGTALAHSPHETDIGQTSNCEEVVLFRISDEAAIRLTEPPGLRDSDRDDYDESPLS